MNISVSVLPDRVALGLVQNHRERVAAAKQKCIKYIKIIDAVDGF